jgi:hypothetical protein
LDVFGVQQDLVTFRIQFIVNIDFSDDLGAEQSANFT